MSSSDIYGARSDLVYGLDDARGSMASLFTILPESLLPTEHVAGDYLESCSEASMTEVLHNPLDVAEQRNAEDSPPGRARPISPGLGG